MILGGAANSIRPAQALLSQCLDALEKDLQSVKVFDFVRPLYKIKDILQVPSGMR